ncbi:hypothetical protein ERO13_D01G134240v2 [Gossypium hirsutum]|nr:hypothetical protein ERO13_D01G134240v2 [Gossypium hirsutum]
MSVKMQTTRTWIERPYEASLFPGIGFGPFLSSLGGRQRRPPSVEPEPSVRYHFGRARIITLCQDLWAKGQSQGWAVYPLKPYVSWVQNVVRQFSPYLVWVLEH